MSDAQLVREVLAGRVESYDPLVRRWAPRVMAVCHARVGRADCVDDLTQETLFRGLRALPTLSDPEKFGPWLCGIAVRTCLDWLKASARTEVTMSALPQSSAATADGIANSVAEDASPGDAPSRQEEIHRLMSEVERLPLPYRQVLMHFYYDDWTYRQIGTQLGISAATVNMRLTRARRMLRDRLVVDDESRRS